MTLSAGQFMFKQVGIAAHVKIISPVAGFASVCVAGSIAAITYINAHNAVVKFDFARFHPSADTVRLTFPSTVPSM